MKDTSENGRKQPSRENSTRSQGLFGIWSYRPFVRLGRKPNHLYVSRPSSTWKCHTESSHLSALRLWGTQICADFPCLCFGAVPGSSPSCSNSKNMLYLRHLWKYKGHCTSLCECLPELVHKQKGHSAHPRTCFGMISMWRIQSWEKVKAESHVTPTQSCSFHMLEQLL